MIRMTIFIFYTFVLLYVVRENGDELLGVMVVLYVVSHIELLCDKLSSDKPVLYVNNAKELENMIED